MTMTEYQALNFLKGRGIATVAMTQAASADEAMSFAAAAGYPLVLKANIPDVYHKSEIGGVKTGIVSETMLREAWTAIETSARVAGKICQGMLVQKMVRGFEVIVGGTWEEEFGPVVMVGTGGIYTEIFRDVAFRLAPIDQAEAGKMINELKAASILDGARGQGPLCRTALKTVIAQVAELMAEGTCKAVDLNPVILTPDAAVVVDALIFSRD